MCFSREGVQRINDRLLSLLSDSVKTYVGVEDTINKKLSQVVHSEDGKASDQKSQPSRDSISSPSSKRGYSSSPRRVTSPTSQRVTSPTAGRISSPAPGQISSPAQDRSAKSGGN